jgi:hypothetical protein
MLPPECAREHDQAARATCHFNANLSAHETTPKNSAENVEPTTMVA